MLPALIHAMLLRLSAKTAHRLLRRNLDWMTTFEWHRSVVRPVADHSRNVMGLRFPNPVGLAAGFDTEGTCVTPLGAFGFGHVEVGSVTLQPQTTTFATRRNRTLQSIQHALHGENAGIDSVAKSIRKSAQGFRLRGGIVGINIAKGWATPVETALEEIRTCLRESYRDADYITLNLASFASTDFLDDSDPTSLHSILHALEKERTLCMENLQLPRKPIAVKLPAEFEGDALRQMLDTIVQCGMDGIISTGASRQSECRLSGAPLAELALRALQQTVEHLQGRLPVIASGGIVDIETVEARAKAGADLIQLHTGFVFQGPCFVADAIEAFDRAVLPPHFGANTHSE